MREKLTFNKIHRLLVAVSTAERRKSIQRYFKEGIDAIGVTSPDLRPIERETVEWCKSHGGLPVAIKLAKSLWKNGAFEERAVACFIIRSFQDEFCETTWKLAGNWVNDLQDWASCDNLSAHIIGGHLDGFPDRRRELLKWTKSRNRWRRRAAAVALVEYARKGKYLTDVWRVAAPLMPDNDDMVRKGVGWLLREAARTVPEKVVNFCKKHEHHTARLILRTAAETMPDVLKRKLLGKVKKIGCANPGT